MLGGRWIGIGGDVTGSRGDGKGAEEGGICPLDSESSSGGTGNTSLENHRRDGSCGSNSDEMQWTKLIGDGLATHSTSIA